MTDTPPHEPSLIRLARESGHAAPDPQPLDLGARVRSLRKARGLTLEQAATQAGLARSTLSKIENGQMSLNFEVLKKLAIGLEISVPQLFTPPQDARLSGRMAVTRGGEGEAPPTATCEHELLAGADKEGDAALPGAGARAASMSSTAGCAMTARSFSTCSPARPGCSPGSANRSRRAAATAPV